MKRELPLETLHITQMSIFILDTCAQVQLVTADVSLAIVKLRVQKRFTVWAVHSKVDICSRI
jgi:hypothetical protein